MTSDCHAARGSAEQGPHEQPDPDPASWNPRDLEEVGVYAAIGAVGENSGQDTTTLLDSILRIDPAESSAESASLTVLHYDADYDHIATMTGQPTEWIVERGSVN